MNKELFKKYLLECGMKPNLCGFTYILDIMLMIDKDYPNLEKWDYYYCTIAKNHFTSSRCVEKAIRHAFESMRGNLKKYDLIDKYFGYDNCSNSASLTRFYEVTHKKYSEQFALITTNRYSNDDTKIKIFPSFEDAREQLEKWYRQSLKQYPEIHWDTTHILPDQTYAVVDAVYLVREARVCRL